MSTTDQRAGIWGRLAAAPGCRARGDGPPAGVWSRLRAELDPAEFRPKLAGDIEIKEFKLRWGNDYVMLANPRDLIHYRLEPSELEIVRLMDGTRTVKEIVVDRFRESGDLELGQVVDLVRQLRVGGFLDPPYVDAHGAVERALSPSVVSNKVRGFMSTLSVDWSDADRVVRWFYRHGLKWFFRPTGVALGVALGAAGVVAFVLMLRSGRYEVAGGRSAGLAFLILTSLNYFITFVHEMGHAVVLTHYGRRVKSAGFQIYYGSPAFFVESSDGLMLDRGQRIVQSAAGPFAELTVAGVAAIVAFLFPDAAISQTLFTFVVLNYFVLFMNLIPLLELDGYYIVADLIQVPDLRPRALAFVRHDLWRKVRERERFSRSEVGLALYGVLGIAFAGFSIYVGFFFWRAIFGRLIGRLWEGGINTRLLLILLALLIAGPIVRGAVQFGRSLYRRARSVWLDIVFRLERSWRIEAARLIDAIPMFDDVPEEVLSELAGRVRLRTVSRGQTVVRQGERADAFYVVRRGRLQVIEEDPDTGAERPLRTLGPGDSFGELGLLEAAPRAATIRALEDAELFQVEKGTFEHLLADVARAPDFAPTLQAAAELRELPSFAHLEPAQLADLLEHGEWVNFPPGSTIVEQGERGEGFYAIRSGQVEVAEDGTVVATLGPGSYFGEIALLLDVPRVATVRARTPVRAYRLDRDGFDRLVGEAFRKGTLNPQVAVDRAQRH